jgi:hypothetical protein
VIAAKYAAREHIAELAALRGGDERTRHIAANVDGVPKSSAALDDPQHRGMRQAL